MRGQSVPALAVLAAGAFAAGAVWLLSTSSARNGTDETAAALAGNWESLRISAAQVPSAPPPGAPLPASGLSHSVPPPLEELRGDVARQAAYDAEAKPGEFVTPPNIAN